jgi:hypothetical protein
MKNPKKLSSFYLNYQLLLYDVPRWVDAPQDARKIISDASLRMKRKIQNKKFVVQNNGSSTIDFTNAGLDSLDVGVPKGTTNLSNMDDKFVEIPPPIV